MSRAAFEFLVDGQVRKISVESKEGVIVVDEGGRAFEAGVRRISANELRLDAGGRSVRVFLARDGERTFIAVGGRQFVVAEALPESCRPGEGDDAAAGGIIRVKAPMPGKVTKIAVAEGEEVRKNQTLVVVEAMKMENEIKTACDGVVRKIHAAAGDLVDADRPLVEIEKK